MKWDEMKSLNKRQIKRESRISTAVQQRSWKTLLEVCMDRSFFYASDVITPYMFKRR